MPPSDIVIRVAKRFLLAHKYDLPGIEEEQLFDWPSGEAIGAVWRWEENVKAAKRKGLPSCEHCGKGINPGKAWLLHHIPGGDGTFLRMDVSDQLGKSVGAEWVKLGPECGLKVPAKFRKKAPNESPNPE